MRSARRRIRVGVLGLHVETAWSNPLATGLGAFLVAEGEALWRQVPLPVPDELGAEALELVPITYARARPGGRVRPGAFDVLLRGCRQGLREAGPLDALLLLQHGGMRVASPGRGASDPDDPPGVESEVANGEARLAEACRAELGPAVPIVATFDPHGDPGPRTWAALDGACAFRTAPHVDVEATRARALRVALAARELAQPPALREAPTQRVAVGAMAEGPGPPAAAFGVAEAVGNRPGTLDASLILGSAWTDPRPRGMTYLVVAERAELASRYAAEAVAEAEPHLAGFAFPDPVVEPAEAAAWAQRPPAETAGPRWLLDAGDAIGAGGVGDRFDLTFALLDARAQHVLVAGVVAPGVVRRCLEAGEGAIVDVDAGPELAPESGPWRRCRAKVVRVVSAVTAAPEDGVPPGRGPEVLVDVAGVRLLLCGTRRAYEGHAELIAAGCVPERFGAVVLKAARRPPGVADGACWTVTTPGATDHRVPGPPPHAILEKR